ncbi:hypothetical protein ANANG_G00274140 [Anguilla anguilla]|uniref:Uncharacterized protein n=1 Tax=Anguilla anguilla TaxID=7936 RepID=A0A9D3LMD4_ANGAN|nr:hypothetical protein ANANG_G00274140 [Anguilla anguilla]
MKEPAVPLILNMLIINAIISINISGLLADNQLKAELGVLAKVMDIGRIFFFIAVTVAVILLTLCWALKLKGKLFPRDRPPPTHSPASQELLEVPPPPRCQQSGTEMPDDNPSADSEPSDYETCI